MKVSNFILSEHQPWTELLETVQGFLLPSNINPLGLGSQIKAASTLPLNTVYQAFVKGVGCSGIETVTVQFKIGITTNWGSGYLIPFEGNPLVVKSVVIIEDGTSSVYTTVQWVNKGLFVPVNKNLKQGKTVTAEIHYYTAVNYEGAEKPVSLLLDREELISIVPSIVTTETGTVKVRVVGKGKIASIEASNGTWRTQSENIPTWLIGSEVTEAGDVTLTTRYGRTATLHVSTMEESIKAVPIGDVVVPYGAPVKYQLIGTGVIDKVERILGPAEATYTLSSYRLPAIIVIFGAEVGIGLHYKITLKGGKSVTVQAYANNLDWLIINDKIIVKDKLNLIPEYHVYPGGKISSTLKMEIKSSGTEAGNMRVKIAVKGQEPFFDQIVKKEPTRYTWIDTPDKPLLCDVEVSYEKTPYKFSAELRLPANTYIPSGVKVEGARALRYQDPDHGGCYSQVFDDFEYKMHDSVVSILCGIRFPFPNERVKWKTDGYEHAWPSKDVVLEVPRIPSLLWGTYTEPWIEAPLSAEQFDLSKSRQEYIKNTFGVEEFFGYPIAPPLLMKGGPRYIQRETNTFEHAIRTAAASYPFTQAPTEPYRFALNLDGSNYQYASDLFKDTVWWAYHLITLVYLIADDPYGLVNYDFTSHSYLMDKTLKMVPAYNDNSKKVEYVMPEVTAGSGVVTWIPKLKWRVAEISLSEIQRPIKT